MIESDHELLDLLLVGMLLPLSLLVQGLPVGVSAEPRQLSIIGLASFSEVSIP